MATIIKYVFWDFGDTLVGLKPEIRHQIMNIIFEQCGRKVAITDLDKAMRDEWKLRGQPDAWEDIKRVVTQDQERKYYADFFNGVLRRLGIEKCVQSELLIQLANLKVAPTSYHVFPDALCAVDELCKLGVSQAIISNGFHAAHSFLSHSELRGKFDFEIWSYEHGTIKPEREIYRIALERAGCRSEEAVFVDDRKLFIEAAKKTGMHAMWIDRSQPSVTKQIDEEPLVVIKSLTEVGEYVHAQRGRQEISFGDSTSQAVTE